MVLFRKPNFLREYHLLSCLLIKKITAYKITLKKSSQKILSFKLGSTGAAPGPPHPYHINVPIRHFFLFFHSPIHAIRPDLVPILAEIYRNPPKLAEKLTETHVKKIKINLS